MTTLPKPVPPRSFDPSKLKVEVKNTTIGALCDMLRNNMIDLQPDFQRHPNLWTAMEKSRLIESLLLGIPIPSMYFCENAAEKKWVVIDGLQRLCALRDFIASGKMRLKGLQLLRDKYEGHCWEDLSYFEQLTVTMRDVTLNVISGDASTEAMYIIFQRINSKSTVLRPAEIRHALYAGQAMDMVRRMAESEEFREATGGKVSARRMLDLDYASRFLAFHTSGYENYEDNKMDEFIGRALTAVNREWEKERIEEAEQAFREALSLCHDLLEEDTFRQPLTEKERRNSDIKSNPLSIALFEATMCAAARLTAVQRATLMQRKTLFRKNYSAAFTDQTLIRSLSSGTNKYKSVQTRFLMLENVARQTLDGKTL